MCESARLTDVGRMSRGSGKEGAEVTGVAGEIFASFGLLGVVLGGRSDRVVDEETDVGAPQLEEGRLGLVAEDRADRVAEGDGVVSSWPAAASKALEPSRPR